MLCNVAQFTQAEVAALDAPTSKQGGGVVVFDGKVIADNYNQTLHVDRQGTPARGGAWWDWWATLRPRRIAFGFDAKDYKHPIVSLFAGADSNVIAGLTGALTLQYHKLKIPEGSMIASRNVALWFSSGDPAIIRDASPPRPGLIQVATSASIPPGPTGRCTRDFPPIMEQVITPGRLGSARRAERPGRPAVRPGGLPHRFGLGRKPSVEVTRPDEVHAASKLKPSGDVSLFHFEETDLSGAYRAKFGPPLALESIFAANPDPIESDPFKLDRAGLTDAVPGWAFTYLTNWKDLTTNSTSVGRRGELHRPLLWALLAFLIIESIAAWKFGHH